MIYINVILTVRHTDDVAEVREFIKQHGELSRAEPGCLRFEVYQSQNDPNVFVLNEHWATQADLDVHQQAVSFNTIYTPKIVPHVDRVVHISDLVE